MKFPTKEQLSNWILDGTWSLGLATILSKGVISPLTLVVSAALFAVQARGNFPIARTARAVVNGAINFYDDYIDGDYIETQGPLNKKQHYKEYGQASRMHEKPIDDGLQHELEQNYVETYVAGSGLRLIPGITWLFGEKKVAGELPKLDTAEIANMDYGTTRSGGYFKLN